MTSIISGHVRTRAGQPVAQARVYFRQGPGALPDIAVLTDARGAFSLAAPQPGSYQLGCAADGFATASVAVRVPGDGQPVQTDVVLRP